MNTWRKQHKQAIQAAALLLTMIAVVPIYIGLQNGSDFLAMAGLGAAALGMAAGLWGS